MKKRKAVVEDVARLRNELDEKEKELKELNDALEPSNGVQRSPSLQPPPLGGGARTSP